MTLARRSEPELAPDERRIHVVQGEYFVTDDPTHVLTAILGSCIATCIRDPAAGVGGMNHFLLPGETGSDGLRYGVNSMELLVNALLQKGARRDRLEARIFGGAKVVKNLSDIGAQNAVFAERFLADEGIPVIGRSTGGEQARRVQFWPHGGRSRQKYLSETEASVVERPLPPAPAAMDDGSVELF